MRASYITALLAAVLVVPPSHAAEAAPPSPKPGDTVQPAAPAPTDASAEDTNSDDVDDENDAEDALGIQEDVNAGKKEMEELQKAEAQAIPDSDATPRHFGRIGPANPLGNLIFDSGHRAGEIYDVPSLAPQGDAGGLLAELGGLDLAALKAEYDIPIEINADVIQYIRFFQGAGRKWYVHWLQRSKRWIPIMRPILAEEGVPLDLVYLAMIESGFSPYAYSWARASGFWQFISETGRRYGLRDDFWVDERRDPILSTRAAARYLKQLHDQTGDWYLAWASYNAGEGRVQHAIRSSGLHDFWQIAHSRAYLRKETRYYVPKLIAAALIAKHPERFGFTDIVPEGPFNYEQVEIPDAMDLQVVARAAGVTMEELQEMNPQLRRWCTPPPHNGSGYRIKLPVGAKAAVTAEMDRLSEDRLTFRHHHLNRGESIASVAKKFHTTTDGIMRMNGIASVRQVKAGMDLIIPVAPEYAKNIADSGADWREPAVGRHGRHRHSRFAQRQARNSVERRPARFASPERASSGRVASRPGQRYVVASGDTLWNISRRFNVELSALKRWNGLNQDPHRLQVGRAIYISPPPSRKAERSASVRKGRG